MTHKPTKVLFIIFNRGSGVGGHFHSLDTISGAIKEKVDCSIISLGPKISPVVAANPLFKEHIYYESGKSVFGFWRLFRKQLAALRPDVLHFFDTESLTLAAPCIAFSRYKVVMNKCGGPNPFGEKWVFAPTIVLFSLENYKWFSAARFYKNAFIKLIPNRVAIREPLGTDQHTLQVEKSAEFSIVRIGRIGNDYKPTLISSIRLAAFYGKLLPVTLYFIGRIQDNEVFNELMELAGDLQVKVEVIADERANKAYKFLYLADVVVGTGRSAMEAMSYRIPVFAPVENYELPILLNEKNFDIFFEYNFSNRTRISEYLIKEQEAAVNKLPFDKNVYDKAASFVFEAFNKYYNAENGVDQYVEVYNAASRGGNFSVLFKNLPYVFRTYLTSKAVAK